MVAAGAVAGALETTNQLINGICSDIDNLSALAVATFSSWAARAAGIVQSINNLVCPASTNPKTVAQQIGGQEDDNYDLVSQSTASEKFCDASDNADGSGGGQTCIDI